METPVFNSETVGTAWVVIRDFLAGYQQGAKTAAPDVRVDAVYAGTFDDPAKGSELTQTLYGQGSDIVYNVAGPTGEGVTTPLTFCRQRRTAVIGGLRFA